MQCLRRLWKINTNFLIYIQVRRLLGKSNGAFDLSATSASSAENSCFSRFRQTFLKGVVHCTLVFWVALFSQDPCFKLKRVVGQLRQSRGRKVNALKGSRKNGEENILIKKFSSYYIFPLRIKKNQLFRPGTRQKRNCWSRKKEPA